MTRTIAALFAIAVLTAVPATASTEIANSGISPLCTEQGPESYKRPGGYCDQLDDTKSLAPSGERVPCRYYADAGIRFDDEGSIMVVGVNPCCGYGSLFDDLVMGDSFLVAC